jgi:hypothetical protein
MATSIPQFVARFLVSSDCSSRQALIATIRWDSLAWPLFLVATRGGSEDLAASYIFDQGLYHPMFV